jgi:hypothetical protein
MCVDVDDQPNSDIGRIRSLGPTRGLPRLEATDQQPYELFLPGVAAYRVENGDEPPAVRERLSVKGTQKVGYVQPVFDAAASTPILEPEHISPVARISSGPVDISLIGLQVVESAVMGSRRILISLSAIHDSVKRLDVLTLVDLPAEQPSPDFRRHLIFSGILAGAKTLFLEGTSIVVTDPEDYKFLEFLTVEPFQAGTHYSGKNESNVQAMSILVRSLAQLIAQRNRLAQSLHLSFVNEPTVETDQLAEGYFIVVQIPPDGTETLTWSDWLFDPVSGAIVNRQRGHSLPYSYVAVEIRKTLR